MKDGGSFHKHKNSTLIVITFTFFCFFFLSSKAEAESFCVGCPTATAANCTVSTNCPAGGSGGGVCPTLDDAVTDALADMTLAAETVKIAQGTHTGPGTAPVIDPPFGGGALTTKTINILGGFNSTCTSRTVNAANTIIMAPGGQRVFDIDAARTETLNITIDNVTNQNGTPGSLEDGGGIRARATGAGGSLNFTSTNNTYNTNAAPADGGGVIFYAGGGTVTITNQNNIISSNTATAGPGGGIQAFADLSNLNVTISEDIISGNSANTTGGGVSIESDTGFTTTAILEKNIINNNIAALSGGGINFFSSGTINATQVSNNMIFKNQAQGASPDGGGGVAASAGSGTTNLKFVNNTIADNDANGTSATGGGILVDSSAGGTINMTLPNDIIYFNTCTAPAGKQIDIIDPGAPSPTIALRASVVQQGTGDLDPADIGMGAGFLNFIGTILSADPDFVDPPSNDYHLDSSSPAIDAGANAADPGEGSIPDDGF